MKKIEIAFCIQNERYKERFVKCWMHHYKMFYNVYLFSDIQELLQKQEKVYDVIVTDFEVSSDIKKLKQAAGYIFVLLEPETDISELEKTESVIFTSKYQEIYKLEEKIRVQVGRNEMLGNEKPYLMKKDRIIGVFSIDYESMQMPFAMLLACEYGEKKETLLINLQAYSGFDTENAQGEDVGFGLEDLMASSMKKIYSKDRLYETLGHEQSWDYIYSPKNTEILSEGNMDLYHKIIEIMEKEFGYHNIIINFGTSFCGMCDLMEDCDEFYLVVPKSHSMSAREKNFRRELQRKEKDVLLQQIKRAEIPYVHWGDYQECKKLVQQWRWSEIGDMLRQYIWTG